MMTDASDQDTSKQTRNTEPHPNRIVRLCLAAALLIGVRLFLAAYFDVTLVQFGLIIAAAVLACIPQTARAISTAMDRLRCPGRTRRLIIAAAIWAAGSGYLAFTARAQHRPLWPEVHDENSYLIQAHMLARGRLWMPQHPLPDSFESFHMLSKPVYAPIYFPGTALLYSPTAFFNLPTWALPVCCSGLCLALLYLVATSAIDGVQGLIAALLLVSVAEFRTVSVMFLSQIPAMLLGLCCIGSWIPWQKRARAMWALLLGVSVGWCSIIRPVDALAFVMPVAIAMVIELRRRRFREQMQTLVLVAAGITPFLALQLLFDYGTTGNALVTPYQLYLHRDQPGTEYGFWKFDPAAHPESKLLQKQDYYTALSHQFGLAEHRLDRLPAIMGARIKWIIENLLPTNLLLIPLLAGPFALWNVRRWVIVSVAPAFALLYVLNPFSAVHYSVPAAAAVVFYISLGIEAVGLLARSSVRRRAVNVFATLAVAGCAIGSLPEVRGTRGGTGDAMFYPPLGTLAAIRDELAALPAPAVVFFRYRTGDRYEAEPVYNSDVAWPDDARIVRAHALGLQVDQTLVEYYAHRSPKREFYFYDAHDMPALHRLGNPADPSAVLRELRRFDEVSTPPMP